MKFTNLLFIVVLFFIPLIGLIAAQTDEETLDQTQTTNTNDIDVTLDYESQDPGSKEFTVVATITTKIDSDRVIVNWTPGSGMRFGDDEIGTQTSTTIRSGEETIVKKNFEARYQGEQEIKVAVTAVKADVNYITSDTLKLEFNSSLEIVPMREEYKDAKLTYQVIRILFYSLIGAGIVIVGVLIYRRVKSIS